MDKKKISLRAFGIAVIAGFTLVVSGCSGSSGGEQTAPKTEDTNKIDKGKSKDELQLEKEMQAEMNEKFKDADEVVREFLVARFESDLDTLEALYLPDSKGYEDFEKYDRQNLSAQNNGVFSEDIDEYYFIRYSSEYEKTGKLYYQTYVYGSGSNVNGTAAVSVNLALTKNDENEWRVEESGTRSSIFPQSMEKYGGTASELHFDGKGNLIKNN
ncbi:hypothetical protein MXL46_09245 [Heyndrickxia sporothermodurans]|uniref:DUF5104 domain-containing protein n=1 Tax=Siminovitchia thermophila TaxID=1245522 RepID=A0ABS2R9E9_9BACI|nr:MULTISPECIES: hypothetical protein [Bacillaceae]MBM7716015.1 hypothetical protein [Siminovitchia thermophila]MEB6549278.1 hypothetical protein [Heyndrickxia sporothermodurans]